MAYVSVAHLPALWPWSGCLPFWTFVSDIKLFLYDAVSIRWDDTHKSSSIVPDPWYSINGNYYYQTDVDYNFMKLFPTHNRSATPVPVYSKRLLGIQTPVSFKCSLDSGKCITCHIVSSKWRLFLRTHTEIYLKIFPIQEFQEISVWNLLQRLVQMVVLNVICPMPSFIIPSCYPKSLLNRSKI